MAIWWKRWSGPDRASRSSTAANPRGTYVREGAILNEQHREAYKALRPDNDKVAKEKSLNPRDDAEADKLRMFMCDNFFDVRTFGAVMSTGINCGQVRGPVQVTFAQSIEPEKAERQAGDDNNERTDNRTMGRKHIVPYGLYRAHGFISAKLAERTGFTEADLDLLFEALESMFEHDRSAARGEMASRKLIVFKHATALGKAPAHALFDRVKIGRYVDGEFRDVDDRGIGNLPPARKFTDYKIQIDRDNLPEGIEIIERV
jgi:CRISPR-associated protein Csd2